MKTSLPFPWRIGYMENVILLSSAVNLLGSCFDHLRHSNSKVTISVFVNPPLSFIF